MGIDLNKLVAYDDTLGAAAAGLKKEMPPIPSQNTALTPP